MALTITKVKPRQAIGSQWEITVDVLFDNSYTANGMSFTPNDVDPAQASTATKFHFVNPVQKTVAGTSLATRVASYDYTNEKLQLWTALGTQAAGASDQSSVTVRCQCRYGQIT